MRLSAILPLLAVALTAIMSGCSNSGERAGYIAIAGEKWAYADTLRFAGIADTLRSDSLDAAVTTAVDSAACDTLTARTAELTESQKRSLPKGRLSMALRHTNAYPYRNLWLEIGYTTADGIGRADTVAIELCDSYGRWYGKGIGDLYQDEAVVAEGLRLYPGSELTVRHIMRVDTLIGIERVGLFFNPTSEDL